MHSGSKSVRTSVPSEVAVILSAFEIALGIAALIGSAAKVLIMGSWHSTEDASIKISSLKSGEIVYAYSVHEDNSTHGEQSSAEACAKHLKDDGIARSLSEI